MNASSWFPPRFLQVLTSLLILGALIVVPGNVRAGDFQQLLKDRFSVSGDVRETLVLENGQAVIGGNFDTVNGVRQGRLARLNPDGTIDSSWQPKVDHVIEHLALDEGYVYFTGRTSGSLGRVRLDGDGTVDPDWNPVIPVDVRNLELAQDFAVGGGFVYYLTTQVRFSASFQSIIFSRLLLRRFSTANSRLDPAWGVKVVQSYRGEGEGLLALDAGFIYVQHANFTTQGFQRLELSRYSVLGKGALDRAWNYPIPHTRFGNVFAIDQDSEFLYFAGSGLHIPGATGGNGTGLGRISKATGKVDRKWPFSGDRSVTGYVTGLSVNDGFTYLSTSPQLVKLSNTDLTGKDTKIVEVGPAYGRLTAGTRGIYLSVSDNAYTGEAEVVRPFDPASLASRDAFHTRIFNEGVVKKVQRMPNGSTFVSGQFSSVGDVSVQNLVRFLPDGSLDREWRPTPGDLSAAASDFQIQGDSIYVKSSLGLQKFSLAAPGLLDASWKPSATLGNGIFKQAVFTATDVYFSYAQLSKPGAPYVVAKAPLSGNGAPVLLPGVTGEFGVELFIAGNYLYVRPESRVELRRYELTAGNPRDNSWQVTLASRFGFHYLQSRGGFVYVVDGASISRYAETGAGERDASWNPTLPLKADGAEVQITSLSATRDYLYLSGVDTPFAYLVRINFAGETDAVFAPQIPFVALFDSGGSIDLDLSGAKWIGAIGDSPLLGGALAQADGIPADAPIILGALPAPILTRSGLAILASLAPESASQVEAFRIVAVQGGTLSLGATGLSIGDVVPVAMAQSGFVFTPAPGGSGTQSVTISSTAQGEAGLRESSGTTIDLTVAAAVRSRYAMSTSALTVREGAGSAIINVQKIGGDAGQVTLTVENGLARAGEQFDLPANLTIDFPAGDSTKALLVPIRDDLVFTGNKDFRVVLCSASDNGIIADPGATVVTIQDDDPLGTTASLTERPALPALPAANASLRVLVNAPLGAWRLLGEVAWHPGGETLPGLTRGNYFVEFRPVNGFLTPPARTIPVDFGELVSMTGDYVPLVTSGTGGFSVLIQPESVATADLVDRGQWRIPGESQWRDSGSTIEDVPIGTYDVEFKTVSGRVTPPSLTVKVTASTVYTVTGTYLIASPAIGAAAAPLNFASVQSDPYQFVGQIQTPIGLASGTAMRSHTVLTVAHALFDDDTLSAVTDARWFHQKAKGSYEPAPQVARGWYVFQGYAAQRTADLSGGGGAVGVSTAESQQLDLAAMWFLSPVARGSFAGYLTTDAANDWLLASRRRILAGYPVEGVPEANQGVLHATDLDVPSAFTALNETVRATNDLRGFPGMSGGPLFVERDGTFYPAGVFLGGTAQTLVRVIDAGAVDLINRAETSGNGGDNNVGGGITVVSPGVTASPFTPTLVTCSLSPAGAVAQGAAWRLAGEKDFLKAGTRLPRNEGTYRVEFKPVPGFATPDSRAVSLVEGQLATVKATYLPSASVTTSVTPASGGKAPSGDYALGREAVLTARPASGFIFNAWKDESGNVIARAATLKLVIDGPRSLTAVFEPGSFLTYGGTYAGFRSGVNGADGGVSISVTKDGKFTGQVVYKGQTVRFKGGFDQDGFFTGTLGKALFTLKLDRSSPVGAITGTVFDSDPPSTISTTQSPYSTANPTPLAGVYALVLPAADPTDPLVPPGTGAVSLAVADSGAVRYSGVLADGAAVSGASYLVDGNQLPFFAAYQSSERIAGTLAFATSPPPARAAGSLSWSKAQVAKGKLYPDGFDTEISARLRQYDPAAPLSPQALHGFAAGALNAFDRTVTFNTKGIGADSSDSTFRLTYSKASGRFSGSVMLSGQKLTLEGIVDPETGQGLGFFFGNGPTAGALELSPPAN